MWINALGGLYAGGMARLLASELNITPAQARAKFAAAWTAENGGG